MAGLEHDILAVVLGPVPVKDPSLFFQLVKKAGARKWGQVTEIHSREPGLLYKLYRRMNGLRRVSIETEDERSLDVNPPGMDLFNHLFVPALEVYSLADGAQDIVG
jgi:hypothetical protein